MVQNPLWQHLHNKNYMKHIFNKKITLFIVTLVISLAAWAATQIYKPGGFSGSDKSTNITLVKKRKLMYPIEAIGGVMFAQNECVTSKKTYLKEVKKQDYVPSADEVLTPAQIEPYFDATIEEYFRGTDYARIVSGRTILRDTDPFVAMQQDPGSWNCAFKVADYKEVTIQRLDKKIDARTGINGANGVVQLHHIRPENQEKRMPLLKNYVQELDVPGSTYKCSLHTDLMGCYFRDMPIHLASKQPVMLQLRKPPEGSLSELKKDPEKDKWFAPYPGTWRGGVKTTIEEFGSMSIGELIADDKFEIPAFAKGFVMKETGKK